MKWFKHFSSAQFDPRLLRVIRKFGLRGYGLYFVCLELISSKLDPQHPMPDMEQNDSDLAAFFNEDTDLIRDMLGFLINEGLFQRDKNSGRLVCLKLLAHLDNTMSNVPQIRAILDNFKKLQETSNDFKQIRLDQIKLDKKKNKEPANAQLPISPKAELNSKEVPPGKGTFAGIEGVLLTEAEYTKIHAHYVEQCGGDARVGAMTLYRAMDLLSSYIGSVKNGDRKYVSHYKVLRGWPLNQVMRTRYTPDQDRAVLKIIGGK